MAGFPATAPVVPPFFRGQLEQPGHQIPPYHPVHDEPPGPPAPRTPVSQRTRHRRYFAMMGSCFVLVGLAWGLVRDYSVIAALVMTAAAAFIPPIAAILTNADSPILRDQNQGTDQGTDQGGPRDPGQNQHPDG